MNPRPLLLESLPLTPLQTQAMAGQRRGMIIKNSNPEPVEIQLARRVLTIEPGREEAVTAEEVRDAALRQQLQVRGISIVRPTTEAEEHDLIQRLERGAEQG